MTSSQALLAPDTETHLIAPGLAAPPMVCTAFAVEPCKGALLHVKDAKQYWEIWLKRAAAGELLLTNVSMHYDMAVVLAMWPDLAEDIFRAYESGNVHCSVVDQRLIDIRDGVLESKLRPKHQRYYSLKAQVSRFFGVDLAKGEDTWQLRYAELEHLPCEEWPVEARRYPIKDAKWALKLKQRQIANGDLMPNMGFEAYAAFALYLQACRGLRTDPVACQKLIKGLEKELVRCEKLLWQAKLLKMSKAGKVTKDLNQARYLIMYSLPRRIRRKLSKAIAAAKAYSSKQAREQRENVQRVFSLDDADFAKAERRLDRILRKDVSHKRRMKLWRAHGYDDTLWVAMQSLIKKPRPFKALGVALSRTGQISVNAAACKASRNEALIAYARFTSANTLRKKAQRMLKGSVIPLQTTYMTPVNSGRTSSRASEQPLVGDNFQNFRRSAFDTLEGEEELPGQRECFVPRDGFVYCSIDLNSAEMRGYAQVEYDHLGVSELRDVLNAGKNPHRVLGAFILGISERDFERRYAAGDEECIRAAQFAKIPNFALLGGGGHAILPDYAAGMGISLDLDEAKELYDAFHAKWCHVAEMHKYFRKFIHKVYTNPRTGFARYLDRYAQACNNPFQNIIAAVAKRCCTAVAREIYVPGGQLNGSYAVLFLHDEILFELREDMASEHAWRATRLMIDAANYYLPDVPMTAEPALMTRFTKGAKTITHSSRLDRDGNPLLLVHKA